MKVILLSFAIALMAAVALRVLRQVEHKAKYPLVLLLLVGICYFSGWLLHEHSLAPEAGKTLGLLAVLSSSALLWIISHYIFIDGFQMQKFHYAVVVLRFVVAFFTHSGGPLPNIYQGLRTAGLWTVLPNVLFTTVFILHAGYILIKTSRHDLVEPRRKLRLLMAMFIGVEVLFWLSSNVFLRKTEIGGLVDEIGLVTIILFAFLFNGTSDKLWSEVFRPTPKPKKPPVNKDKEGVEGEENKTGKKETELAALVVAKMSQEEYFRKEGLTIGALAAKLDVQEYLLRKAINQGLGYRNFNTFLNDYRIKAAKDFLADAGNQDYPLLKLALDLGYPAPGPFNRAFRSDSQMSPSEYRKKYTIPE